MLQNISESTDEFLKLRANNWLYVDKTPLIREVLASGEVNLITRPRRFGKTLNMTMLREFFDDTKDARPLFEGLAVSQDPETMKHCNAYPTLFLTLKEVSAQSWDEALEKIVLLLSDLALTCRPQLKTSLIDPMLLRDFEAVYSRTASIAQLQGFLKLLTRLLFLSKGKRVIVLIDEYDAPIHDGYQYGFYPEVVRFFHQFLGHALKTNQFLERAVLTGILRVAKESIFSGLNNLAVNTVLDHRFATSFGFTESEVQELLVRSQSPHAFADVRGFYNGYRFGQVNIYNPWSILNLIKSKNDRLGRFWLGTSSNQLIRNLIEKRNAVAVAELDNLLRGGTLARKISGGISLTHLDSDSVWGLFLFSGYLTAESWDPESEIAELRIPNEEIRSIFRDEVTRWIGTTAQLNEMSATLLAWDFSGFERHLSTAIARILSVRDLGANEPEKTYHVFVVGLLAHLEGRFEVRSNCEAGEGYADLALIPRQIKDRGFIFEFKKMRLNNSEDAAVAGLAQIRAKGYLAPMYERGVTEIASLGIAFEGKKIQLAVKTVSNGVETPVQFYPAIG